jgi:hypothetical protein
MQRSKLQTTQPQCGHSWVRQASWRSSSRSLGRKQLHTQWDSNVWGPDATVPRKKTALCTPQVRCLPVHPHTSPSPHQLVVAAQGGEAMRAWEMGVGWWEEGASLLEATAAGRG